MPNRKLTPLEWGTLYGQRAFWPDGRPFAGLKTSAEALKDWYAKTHVYGVHPDRQEVEDAEGDFMQGYANAISRKAADEFRPPPHPSDAEKKEGWMPPKGHDPNQGLHDFNQN